MIPHKLIGVVIECGACRAHNYLVSSAPRRCNVCSAMVAPPAGVRFPDDEAPAASVTSPWVGRDGTAGEDDDEEVDLDAPFPHEHEIGGEAEGA